jgi:hypothetical protein
MKAKVNRTNISDHLIEYQLKMIGKTVADVSNDEMWFFNNTMTQEQHEEFKRYAIPLLKKIFKFNKGKAESTFGWFDLQFGLRIKKEEL